MEGVPLYSILINIISNVHVSMSALSLGFCSTGDKHLVPKFKGEGANINPRREATPYLRQERGTKAPLPRKIGPESNQLLVSLVHKILSWSTLKHSKRIIQAQRNMVHGVIMMIKAPLLSIHWVVHIHDCKTSLTETYLELTLGHHDTPDTGAGASSHKQGLSISYECF